MHIAKLSIHTINKIKYIWVPLHSWWTRSLWHIQFSVSHPVTSKTSRPLHRSNLHIKLSRNSRHILNLKKQTKIVTIAVMRIWHLRLIGHIKWLRGLMSIHFRYRKHLHRCIRVECIAILNALILVLGRSCIFIAVCIVLASD